MWNSRPWDNEVAADWFGRLMDQTNMPVLVRQTLLLINEDDPYFEQSSKLRAAVYCVLTFGREDIWPAHELEKDLKLAVFALRKILLDDDYCDSEEITDQIEHEIEELERRLGKR